MEKAAPPSAAIAPLLPEPTLAGWRPSLRERLVYELGDHAILRRPWTNLHRIAPGVWRGNQPTEARLARLKAEGLASVISLRGSGDKVPHRMEAAACARLGLPLYATALNARKAPSKEALLRLIALLRAVPRPVLLHCKSGADRAGLASAVLVLLEGGSIEAARSQLSWRYLHLKSTKTGVLDLVLIAYEKAQGESGISFEDWAAGPYDPAAVQAAFDAGERA